MRPPVAKASRLKDIKPAKPGYLQRSSVSTVIFRWLGDLQPDDLSSGEGHLLRVVVLTKPFDLTVRNYDS